MKRKQATTTVPASVAAHWVNAQAAQTFGAQVGQEYTVACDKITVHIKTQMLEVMRECYQCNARILAREFLAAFENNIKRQAVSGYSTAKAYANRLAAAFVSGHDPIPESGHKSVHDALYSSGDLQKVAECFPKVTRAGAKKKTDKNDNAGASADAGKTPATVPVGLDVCKAWLKERATTADLVDIHGFLTVLLMAKVATPAARKALAGANDALKALIPVKA